MDRLPAIIPSAASALAVMAVTWAVAQPDTRPDARVPPWRHGDLHERYAEMRLRLAQARLEKAMHLNAHVPGQVTESDLRSLRARIDLLRDELDETRRNPHGYGVAAQQRAAVTAVALAEREVEDAAAINRRKSGTISPLDMQLRQLRLDIARLRAEIWDDPAFLASPTDVLQMQIDQLADQLQDVLHDVDNAPTIQRR
ncbi:MAG: hypothetical protein ACKOZU_08860 [Planctomycetaceae bacterium]